MSDEPQMGHVGLPVHINDVIDRIKRGLPVYWPTDPAMTDQRPYRAYLDKEGPLIQP